jgi:hypothetical protein
MAHLQGRRCLTASCFSSATAWLRSGVARISSRSCSAFPRQCEFLITVCTASRITPGVRCSGLMTSAMPTGKQRKPTTPMVAQATGVVAKATSCPAPCNAFGSGTSGRECPEPACVENKMRTGSFPSGRTKNVGRSDTRQPARLSREQTMPRDDGPNGVNIAPHRGVDPRVVGPAIDHVLGLVWTQELDEGKVCRRSAGGVQRVGPAFGAPARSRWRGRC